MITFIHPYKAFLPGLNAYLNFFKKHNVQVRVLSTAEARNTVSDIEWRFMGTHFHPPANPNAFLIHEYCSASAPPFARLKDQIKILRNIRPHYRIFTNQAIHRHLDFKDDIPAGYRDIGIDNEYFYPASEPAEKIYDFIYVGTVEGSRDLRPIFDFFTTPDMQTRTLLVLSNHYTKWQEKYQKYRNIIFKGPVPFGEVGDYIRQSRYGINYIRDQYPLHLQTSTKLLEYAACRIPILTTPGVWIRSFEQEYGGNYYYFNDAKPWFSWDDLSKFRFEYPRLDHFSWEQQIIQSGIIAVLKERFPEMMQHVPLPL